MRCSWRAICVMDVACCVLDGSDRSNAWVGGEECRMHADIFTLTAQKLLFNVSQSNMQEHGPAVWAGKRHGDACQVVQQRLQQIVLNLLMIPIPIPASMSMHSVALINACKPWLVDSI